eukprot:SM000141S00842  [mRNA]  locus=s141:63519:64931:+ [translate_table: standard]
MVPVSPTDQGIPRLPFPRCKAAPDGLSVDALLQSLRGFAVEYVLLAGYLKLLPVELVRAYPRAILNIHPALLPSFGGKGFYGMAVHRAVIKSGARTQLTWHHHGFWPEPAANAAASEAAAVGLAGGGPRFSGPTVHFVDEHYDHGPIVAQRIVPVLPFDSPQDLAKRVLEQEHQVYVQVVAALCEDRITWREDGVPLLRTSWDECEYL